MVGNRMSFNSLEIRLDTNMPFLECVFYLCLRGNNSSPAVNAAEVKEENPYGFLL